MGMVVEPTHSCGVSDLFRDPLVSFLCPPVWGVRGELFVLVFVLFFDRARGERLREPLRKGSGHSGESSSCWTSATEHFQSSASSSASGKVAVLSMKRTWLSQQRRSIMARARSQTPFTLSRSAHHHELLIVLKGLMAAPPHH